MFRSAGSVSYIFKKLKATVRGGGGCGARTPNVKVELNISVSHPKNVVRVTSHPDNQEMAMRLAAAAHPVRRGLNEAVKGVVKGDVCYFKTNARLDYLLVESQTHLLEMKYITEMIERVAKYSGCPPPPRPPASSSKEEAKRNGGGAKVNGGGTNDDGAKGNGGRDRGIRRNL
ncbi:hypothetical protein COP2_008550 [Malus domestica]